MSSIERVILWIIVHWKSFGLAAIVSAIGGALMRRSIYRKNEAERLLAEASRQRLQQEQEIQSLAELIIIWTANRKVALGKSNLIFSEEVLRSALREDADRLHIAMNYLIDKGRAKLAAPGYWSVS